MSTHAANHHEVTLVQLSFDFYMIEAKPQNLIGGRGKREAREEDRQDAARKQGHRVFLHGRRCRGQAGTVRSALASAAMTYAAVATTMIAELGGSDGIAYARTTPSHIERSASAAESASPR